MGPLSAVSKLISGLKRGVGALLVVFRLRGGVVGLFESFGFWRIWGVGSQRHARLQPCHGSA